MRMADELFLIDGNSLAYRAFFALPESIATSTGVPTNAIFGFASMLVKILTDYGPKATVVVWDAGSSGRKEVYSEYKAQRSSRPDLLKEQWPHLEPLVDAFGYRNLRVDGYEADDVIASIAERAKSSDPPIEVMVVTGDRDAYQLVDDGVRIMTTSRGITDTRVYDREGVIDRYGIPPELVPDFIGLKGDTSDNIPGVPGIGDKTAADLLQRFGSLEEVLGHVDDISGAKRKQNLTEHADAARLSKHLATAKRDVEVEFDVPDYASAPPDRSRLRDVFREFELREPLRRLEEALGSADAAAPAPTVERALTARSRPGTLADVAELPPDEVAIAARAPETPEGALFGDDPEWHFGAYSEGDGQLIFGTCARPEDLVGAVGARPAIAHDAKSLGEVPEVLAHDTEVAAYLLEPARRAYPFRELCEERGLAADVADETGRDARLVQALTAWQRDEIRGRGLMDLLQEVELPLVRLLREMELAGVKLDTKRLAEISARVKAEADQLEREIFELAGEEFTLGSPKQLEEVLFGKLGLSRKRRGKTGYSTDARVLQAIREEHEIIPKIERWRELTKLAQTYLDALPLLVDAGQPAAHDLQPDRGDDRTAVLEQPEPPEHPDPDRARARDPRLLRRRAGLRARVGRLLAGRAAAARPHRRRGRAQGDLPPRRGRPHGDRLPRVRGHARPDRPGDALEGEDDQLRDRLRPVGVWDGRPPAHPAIRGRRVHPALPRGVPRGRPFHRGDDRTGHRARLRLDPVRPPASGARAARAALGAAPPGRAVRRQHGHPGHGRRHHEGRDGPL